MLILSFQTTVLATIQILLMGACGFVLVKKLVINEQGLDLLTRLLIVFLLPQFMFYHFTQNFCYDLYPNWWLFPLIGFIIILCGWLISLVMFQLFPFLEHKREFMALVIFQNSGYIPLVLAATLFSGEQAERLYVYIFLLLIGFNLGMWSLGVWLLIRGSGKKFKIKSLLNPPIVAMIFSLVFIACGLAKFLPQTLLRPMKMFSDCVLPLAMIIVGGSLARIRLGDINHREVAAIVIAKLVVFPVLALIVIKVFKIDFLLGFLIMMEAVVPSAVTLSVIARHYNIQEKLISQGIFFTHVVSIVTIPVFLMIYVNIVR